MDPETEPKPGEPNTNPTVEEPPAPQPAPKPGPSDEKAAEKYKTQRDEARQQLSSLQEEVTKLKANGEDVKSLQAELDKARSDAEAASKKAEFERVNTARLAQAGCVDIEIALGLLDENGDVDSLKESKPYLFGAPKGSTGLKPEGAAKDHDAMLAKARKIAGIKTKE